MPSVVELHFLSNKIKVNTCKKPLNWRLFLAFRRVNSEKTAQYECGFDPFDDARSKFDVRFYLVALLFLVMDLEILFCFPFSIALASQDQLNIQVSPAHHLGRLDTKHWWLFGSLMFLRYWHLRRSSRSACDVLYGARWALSLYTKSVTLGCKTGFYSLTTALAKGFSDGNIS